jgi:superfamily II DNA or RNA helicase
MFKLRDYQKNLLDEINANQDKKICVQAATGFGKTVVFTTLAKEHSGRVLILVDSRELVKQTAQLFDDATTFEAKNKIFPTQRIVVSMVQTLKSRLKKHPYLIDDFDLIIYDECHIMQYESVLHKIKCKFIGFTATPVVNRKEDYYFCFDHKHMSKQKNECCKSKKVEFQKDFRLGDIFDSIVIGIPIAELIDKNYLVQDENYVIPLDENNIELDKFGEVSNADEVFDQDYQMDVLGNYREHCQGKKTMIFTQNTALNLHLYSQFVDEGIENCFMYDSVNDSEYNRDQVVEKFRNTPGAILFNVGVFTKGFDVKDVEAIIVSRRISSLSLWIQIVGRGSRTAANIYKDKFIVIDGGNNIERFGMWSDDHHWKEIFESSDDYKPKRSAPEEQVKECDNCGELIPERECICPHCEHNHCKHKEVEVKFGTAVPFNIVHPDGNKIVNYAKSKNKDKFFALKILTSQIVKMFNKIPKEQFERNLNVGVERIIKTYLKPNYLKIIRSDLPSKSNRTYAKQKNILISKLYNKYEI